MKELSKKEMKKLYQYLTGSEAPKEHKRTLSNEIVDKVVELIRKNRTNQYNFYEAEGKASRILGEVYGNFSRYKLNSCRELVETFDLVEDYVECYRGSHFYSIQFTKEIKLDDHRMIEVELYITYANTYIMGYALHNI